MIGIASLFERLLARVVWSLTWRSPRLARRLRMPNYFDWILPDQVVACVHPDYSPSMLHDLRTAGVGLVINLHLQPHPPRRMELVGMRELHLPVHDMTPPTQDQLERGVAAIAAALASGQGVAVHCTAGLGRSGTLIAAYLVAQGQSADDAIAHVRACRPGSVETAAQIAAIEAFAARHQRP